MSFNNIISKISKDAAVKSDEILKKARQEKDKLLKEAVNKGQKEAAALLEQGRITAEHRQLRMKQAAGIYARKLLLSAKQEIMEKVFAGTGNLLCGLSDKKYKDLLKKMVIDAAVSGEEEIQIAKSDLNRLGNNWLNGVNKELAEQQGKKGMLTYSKKYLEKEDGFILIRGNININCTFTSLIKSHRESLEPEIAKVLFL